MQTRKEQLFNATKGQRAINVVPATIKFVHNKKKGIIEPLSSQEKMLCALRKCLAEMSNKSPDGCRYYIAGNKVEVTQTPLTTDGKKGGVQSYRAAGRCRLGVAHAAGHVTSTFVEFTISYKDTVDDRGLADVVYFDPTTIDVINRAGPINVAHLQ